MGLLIAIIVLVLIGLVATVVSAPLRRARAREQEHAPRGQRHSGREQLHSANLRPEDSTRDELEAEREAKYREIRDVELDYRTGKLSREDFEAIDAQLRTEALAILDRLERLTPKGA